MSVVVARRRHRRDRSGGRFSCHCIAPQGFGPGALSGFRSSRQGSDLAMLGTYSPLAMLANLVW